MEEIEPIAWQDGRVLILDQTRLPQQVAWIECRTAGQVAGAIRSMKIRGAPALGVAAAYAVALAAHRGQDVEQAAGLIGATRPTARNLFWALERMLALARAGATADQLLAEAQAIHEQDRQSCRAIGEAGAELIPAEARVLTHCNAGALATGGYGTALGVIRSAHRQGKRISVLVDETRPLLQGARLTAWELAQEGIPTTVIADSAAGYLFSRAEVDLVVVGADRIARNGDAANKIGTYSLAVLAHRHGVPFYVAAPLSTVDWSLPSGDEIPIEERARAELTAPEGVAVRNPAFDVTPARLISAIVTERGVLRRPYRRSLRGALDPQSAHG